jgi:sarcosine oxidase
MRRRSADHASAIVVGAGVFGAAVASALSARGWCVTLIERYAPANSRSSSGDWSRLLRFGHAGDQATAEWYTRSAWRARTLWQALGEEDDRELLADTGAVWFVSGDGMGEDAAERTMRLVGPSCERMSRSQLKSLFPAVHVDDLAYGLFEIEAGVLRASECVRALVRQAVRQGTRVRHGTAVPRGETVVIDEQVLEADRVVWACGAWLGKLFPQWAPIIATRQMVFYWDTDPAWRNGPAWIDARAESYGMPDVDGLGLKAQTSQAGPAVDPDSASGVSRK